MKRLALNLLFLIPFIGFSQTYKCEFSQFKDAQRVSEKSVYHTVDSKTSVNYYEQGFEVKLETLLDGVLSYYITILKNGVSIGHFEIRATEAKPENFLITYTLPTFSGECDCNKQKN